MTITIGSTLNEKNEQVEALSNLIEMVSNSNLVDKEDATRQLINAKEELQDGDPPDTSLIGRFLGKAKEVLAFAEKGSDLYEKTTEVMNKFNVGG